MLEFTQKELSELAGYTYRRLLDINKMLPDDKKLFVKGEGGKYDLALFLRHWVDFNVSRVQRDDDDLDAVKAAHEHVKMQKSELQLRKMVGELVETAAVRRLWASIATEVTQALLGLPTKLAPMLVMVESREQIELLIDREIRGALTAVAETPIPQTDDTYVEPDDEGE